MRIAILEDDPILREQLKLLLGGEKDIVVAGAFGSAEEALLGLKTASPDIMLVDLGLPGMSGIEFIKRAKTLIPELDIMSHTLFDDRETVFSAIKAGASGYILKGSSPRELIEAIHNLADGGSPMSMKIARAVINEFQGVDVCEDTILSRREIEILDGVEKGLSYKELADKLSLSIHTVHTHIKNIYEKLHAKSRHEALQIAKKKKILK